MNYADYDASKALTAKKLSPLRLNSINISVSTSAAVVALASAIPAVIHPVVTRCRLPMPNGKPGDHPFTDMLVYRLHPFPPDVEELLRQILKLDPDFPDGKRPYTEQLRWEQRFYHWARGKNLSEGRTALKAILDQLMRNRDLEP